MHLLLQVFELEVELVVQTPCFLKFAKCSILLRLVLVDLGEELVFVLQDFLNVLLQFDQFVVLLLDSLLHLACFALELVALLSQHSVLVSIPRKFLLDLLFFLSHLIKCPLQLFLSLVVLVRQVGIPDLQLVVLCFDLV